MLHSVTIAAALLGICGSAFGDELVISDAEGFVDIKNGVNRGEDYRDTTILLDADIVFTASTLEEFGAIGDYSSYFLGTLDGQGHTISNLVIESSTQDYFGLFAYSAGAVMKNIVLDGSCSVKSMNNMSSSYYSYVGGLIGKCFSNEYKPCTFENNVNMASVTFDGNMSKNGKYKYMFLGGIAGELSSSGNYGVVVNNCANYGHIVCSGQSGTIYIGGIAGRTYGQSLAKDLYVQNSFNYGTITFNGTSLADTVYIGGIAGFGCNNDIENCLSAGRIESNTTGHISSITGDASSIDITHCFWTEEVGYNISYDSRTQVANSTVVTLNSTVLDELNEYAGGDATWVMLHLNGGSINGLGQDEILVSQKDFPDPTMEGNSFVSWYRDPGLITPFDPKTESFSDVTDLYAGWSVNTYIVTFDFGNGTKLNKTFAFGSAIVYPKDVVMEGYEFLGWDCDLTEMPARDIYTSAVWHINGYALTFDFGNGTNVTYVLQYGDKIKYPNENPEKEGFTFNGWDSDLEYMPAENVTISPRWNPKYFDLTFDFKNGTTTKSSVAYATKISYPSTPVKEGHTFAGWDPKPETMPATSLTIVALWDVNNYTVTFDLGNGTLVERTFEFDKEIEYPEGIAKEGYTLRWSPNITLMPAKSITITAVWDVNYYTAWFDLGNGTVIEESFAFNSTIKYPEDVEIDGYEFDEWEPRPERMPARDVNITATWKHISPCAKVVFNRLYTEEEVVDILMKYTDKFFFYTYFETDGESEMTTVIIRFEDVSESEEFIDNLSKHLDQEETIESVSRVMDRGPSFSHMISPISLLGFLLA